MTASSSVSSGRRSSVRQLDGEDENGAGRGYGAGGGNGRASSKLGPVTKSAADPPSCLDAHLVDDITRLPMRGIRDGSGRQLIVRDSPAVAPVRRR